MHRAISVVRVVLAVAIATPVALQAQVGHVPTKSPYEDMKLGQSVTLSGGWLATTHDPAGVGPDASAFGQIRYDIAVGGPASLFARYTFAPSQRASLLPGVVAVSYTHLTLPTKRIV